SDPAPELKAPQRRTPEQKQQLSGFELSSRNHTAAGFRFNALFRHYQGYQDRRRHASPSSSR
ncbi:MAG TPA: hypothetical protein VIH78_00625, partial [Terriglobales bacterium]